MKRLTAIRPSLGFVVRALAVAAILAGAIAAWRLGALDLLKPDRLLETQAWAQEKFKETPVLVLALYVLAYGVLAGVGLPVALALSLLAGAVFGPVLGGVVLIVGVTLAALVGHWVARSVLLDLMPKASRTNPAVVRFGRLVKKDPFMVVLAARLMPILPFNGVNLAAGLASAPMKAYLPATFLGVIPTSFIYATLGAGLGTSLEDRDSLWAAMRSPTVWGPVAVLAVLSAVATIVRLRKAEA